MKLPTQRPEYIKKIKRKSRKQKGGICSTKVANRIFDTLRSFPSQDRKEALEKAITGGWKDIYPLKKGYKPEEPKNHPNQKVFKALLQKRIYFLQQEQNCVNQLLFQL